MKFGLSIPSLTSDYKFRLMTLVLPLLALCALFLNMPSSDFSETKAFDVPSLKQTSGVIPDELMVLWLDKKELEQLRKDSSTTTEREDVSLRDYSLIAIFIEQNGFALFKRKGSKDSKVEIVRVSDVLAGYELKEIKSEQVTFVKGEEQVVLRLFKSK